MRYNTLTLVNKILNALDLQPVSTIGETEDSEQVLDIVDRVITEVDLDKNWYARRASIRLETSTATADDVAATDWEDNYPAIPWAMKIPDNVEAVYKVFYNTKELSYLAPEEFLNRIVKTTALLSAQAPRYWTSGIKDENYIIFDSYDAAAEASLSSVNSLIYCTQYTSTALDSDLDTSGLTDKYVNLVIQLAIMYGYYEICKNIPMGDRYARRAEVMMSKVLGQNKRIRHWSVHPGNVNFSRRGRRGISITNDEYTDVTA